MKGFHRCPKQVGQKCSDFNSPCPEGNEFDEEGNCIIPCLHEGPYVIHTNGTKECLVCHEEWKKGEYE